jgi:hypothetical protein
MNQQTQQSETGESHTVTHSTRAKDSMLIAALLAGNTFEQAAKVAGISRRTAYKLRQGEEFQKKYRDAKHELLASAVSALHSCATVFVETLKNVCQDPKSRGSEKATAADRGLNTLLRAVEIFEVEERLQKLEALAGQIKQ